MLCYRQPNTFQLVVAYDPSRYQTFTQYVYMDMGWDHEYLVRRSMIGHLSYKQEQHESLQLAPSMKSTAFTLDTRYGNTGECVLLYLICLFYTFVVIVFGEVIDKHGTTIFRHFQSILLSVFVFVLYRSLGNKCHSLIH